MTSLKLIPLVTPAEKKLDVFTVSENVVIGRDSSAGLVLPDSNVSRKHARLEVSSEGFFIEDLGSANGTFVNQQKIQRAALKNGDLLSFGPFQLRLETETVFASSSQPLFQAASPKKETPAESAALSEQDADDLIRFKISIHNELLGRTDLKKLDIGGNSDLLRATIEKTVSELIEEKKSDLPHGVNRKYLIKDILNEALGLGPLEDLLADPTVTEIMVNNKDQIYIEQKGKLVLSSKRFISEAQIRATIERIVAPLGRRIDESTPLVDARLKDGSRVNAIIPPLALKGSSITIRKFSKKPFIIQDLIRFGTMTQNMADFLKLAVEKRQNIVISGGTGSGKTTLLNVVSSFIPSDERIVTVEDAAELKLPQEHVVSLESRPPNIEGKGAILIRDLVKNCLRMRPDRIVVGECRGGEALDMLQAMNTGHDGSLTTGHANTPRDMLSRLETMVLMAGMDLPSRAIREQIASAISLIVQQSRFPDGSRKITHITEVTGMEDLTITMQDIFIYKQTGFDEFGKVKGYYTATGNIPNFVEELRQRGIPVRMELFEEVKPPA